MSGSALAAMSPLPTRGRPLPLARKTQFLTDQAWICHRRRQAIADPRLQALVDKELTDWLAFAEQLRRSQLSPDFQAALSMSPRPAAQQSRVA